MIQYFSLRLASYPPCVITDYSHLSTSILRGGKRDRIAAVNKLVDIQSLKSTDVAIFLREAPVESHFVRTDNDHFGIYEFFCLTVNIVSYGAGPSRELTVHKLTSSNLPRPP